MNYSIAPDGKSITCRTCGTTSHHPKDIEQLYCGCCHTFHKDSDEAGPNLGLCCNCKASRAIIPIVITRRAPVPGKGWGCVVCGLPPDGAVAVLCQACGCADPHPRFVCVGYPKEGVRVPIEQLPPGEFDHDMSKHGGDA